MDNKGVGRILNEFMKVKGVTAVALVGRDGFVIESVSNTNVDMDALGAMVATAVGTGETLGSEFGFGGLESFLTEYANGKILMATALDDVLAIFTDTTSVIGGVRYAVKKNMPDVLRALQ